MDLISKRRVVPERWRLELASTESLPSVALGPGDIIVSRERWFADREILLTRKDGVGVRIRSGDDVENLTTAGLHQLRLIDFHFQSFADGRAYSQARVLRARHGFRGAIRASGSISRDRLSFMERCGFDEFRFGHEEDLTAAVSAFDELSLRYQPDGPDDGSVARHRGYRFRAATSTPA